MDPMGYSTLPETNIAPEKNGGWETWGYVGFRDGIPLGLIRGSYTRTGVIRFSQYLFLRKLLGTMLVVAWFAVRVAPYHLGFHSTQEIPAPAWCWQMPRAAEAFFQAVTHREAASEHPKSTCESEHGPAKFKASVRVITQQEPPDEWDPLCWVGGR